MPGVFRKEMGKDKALNSIAGSDRDYYSGRGRIEETYDSTDNTLYYRPFVYSTPPKIQIWGRRLSLRKEWRLKRIFK